MKDKWYIRYPEEYLKTETLIQLCLDIFLLP